MMFGPFTGIDFVAFNQTIYRIGGNSFFCMDLPAGDYKVVQAQPGGGFAAHFRLGTNPKTFTLKGGNEYFIRGIVSGAIIDFDLADSSQAESDLKKLDFWTKPEIGVDYKLDQ